MWSLVATMLVFFMHTGFSLLEVGSVRFKSTQYILAKNLAVVAMGFLCWFVLGYPLAHGSAGEEPNKFAGSGGFAMEGLYDDKSLLRTWLWQGAFCATSATIASGAMAERTSVLSACAVCRVSRVARRAVVMCRVSGVVWCGMVCGVVWCGVAHRKVRGRHVASDMARRRGDPHRGGHWLPDCIQAPPLFGGDRCPRRWV